MAIDRMIIYKIKHIGLQCLFQHNAFCLRCQKGVIGIERVLQYLNQGCHLLLLKLFKMSIILCEWLDSTKLENSSRSIAESSSRLSLSSSARFIFGVRYLDGSGRR